MQEPFPSVLDRNGQSVSIGQRVRVVDLSGEWFDQLPLEERIEVSSMIGEVFVIEEIDEYGLPWVCKWWSDGAEDRCHSHSVALEPEQMELVTDNDEAAC
jgi:hypothetical protein